MVPSNLYNLDPHRKNSCFLRISFQLKAPAYKTITGGVRFFSRWQIKKDVLKKSTRAMVFNKIKLLVGFC